MSYTLKVVNGDLVADPRGWVKVVGGLEKLSQDILEALLNTDTGNPLWSELTQYIGRNIDDVVKLEVKQTVKDVEKRIQIIQDNTTNTELSEALRSIENVNVSFEHNTLHIYFDALAEDGTQKPMSIDIVANELVMDDVFGK